MIDLMHVGFNTPFFLFLVMFGLLRAFVPCSVFLYIYHGDNFMCFRMRFSHCLPFNEIGLCLFCILVVCGVAASEGILPFIFCCCYYLCGMGFECSDLASYLGLFFFNCVALPIYSLPIVLFTISLLFVTCYIIWWLLRPCHSFQF